jgi:septal ring factor EnvC (AmiA/AmiB activator)
MSELTAEEIVRLIVNDEGALKDLVYHIVSNPDMRMAVISAVQAKMATKQDIRDLRQELKQEMRQLGNGMDNQIAEVRRDIDDLRAQISELRRSLDEWKRDVLKFFRWAIPIILAISGVILGLREFLPKIIGLL